MMKDDVSVVSACPGIASRNGRGVCEDLPILVHHPLPCELFNAVVEMLKNFDRFHIIDSECTSVSGVFQNAARKFGSEGFAQAGGLVMVEARNVQHARACGRIHLGRCGLDCGGERTV